jgi:hypothetical protein
MKKQKKPPLGVMPKDIWDFLRIKDLKAAIDRYETAKMEVPHDWIKEYNDLVNIYETERTPPLL